MFIKSANLDRADLLGEEHDRLDSHGDKDTDVSLLILVLEAVNGGLDREHETRVPGFHGDEVGTGFLVAV